MDFVARNVKLTFSYRRRFFRLMNVERVWGLLAAYTSINQEEVRFHNLSRTRKFYAICFRKNKSLFLVPCLSSQFRTKRA